MLIAEGEDGYRFVTQPDHAEVAGQFATHWGNERFERPDPYAEMVLAADNHDDGWWEYDRRPHLADGDLVDFVSVPPETWIDFYDDGIDIVVELDPYAGLLASMHGSGLRRRRYGLSSSWPDTPPDFVAFVERQETLQTRLATEMHEGGDDRLSDVDRSVLSTLHETGSPPVGTDSRLWHNYELLQVWDALSLTLCTSESPSETTIESVPVAPGAGTEVVTVTPQRDDEFELEPFPFDESPLIVSMPARTVPKADFDTEAELLRAYYGGERETVQFSLRR